MTAPDDMAAVRACANWQPAGSGSGGWRLPARKAFLCVIQMKPFQAEATRCGHSRWSSSEREGGRMLQEERRVIVPGLWQEAGGGVGGDWCWRPGDLGCPSSGQWEGRDRVVCGDIPLAMCGDGEQLGNRVPQRIPCPGLESPRVARTQWGSEGSDGEGCGQGSVSTECHLAERTQLSQAACGF